MTPEQSKPNETAMILASLVMFSSAGCYEEDVIDEFEYSAIGIDQKMTISELARRIESGSLRVVMRDGVCEVTDE